MNREPVNIEFVLKGDVEKEIDKVRLSMKQIGTEGAVSYRNLLNASNEAFNGLSKSAQAQAVVLQKTIVELKQNEEAQDSLKKKFESGEVAAKTYAAAMARLSVQSAELKSTATGISAQLQREIDMNKQVVGSYNQKKAKLKELQDTYKDLSAEEMENVEIGGRMIAQIRQLEKETEKVDKALKGADQSGKGMVNTLESAPGVIGSTVSGLKTLITTSLAFIATPIGAVIAAIVAGLMALKTWFNRTEEGQSALAVASAAFGQVLDSLLNIVSKVGEWLYKAFTKPKEALSDLLDFMKGQLINRFEAIAKMGTAIVKIFSSDWKQGFEDFANVTMQLTTGINDPLQKLIATGKDVYDQALKQADIAKKLHQLDLEEIQTKKEVAEAEKRIAELRVGAKNNQTGEAERLKQIKEAQKIVDEAADKEITHLKTKLELKTQEKLLEYGVADVRKLNIENQKELNELEIQILNKKTEQSNKKRELLDQQNAINNSIKNAKTDAELFAEELKHKKESYRVYYQFIAATDKEYAQGRFKDLIKEGDSYLEYINKKIAELSNKPTRTKNEDTRLGMYQGEKAELTGTSNPVDVLRREMEQKKKLYAEDLEAYQKYLNDKKALLEGDNSENGISLRTVVEGELLDTSTAIQKNLDELVKKYQTYTLALTVLEKDYNRDIARMKAEQLNVNSKYSTQDIDEAIKARTEAYKGAIAKITVEDSDFYTTLFGNLERISKKSIDAAILKAKTFLSKYKDSQGKWLKDIDADTLQLLIKIQEGITKAEDASKSKLPKAINDIADGLGDAANMAQLFDSELANVIDTAAQLAKGIADVAEGIARIVTNDPIGGSVQALSGIMSIVSAFKKNTEASKQILSNYELMLLKRNLSEISYSELLRERLRTTEQIGETNLKYNQRITSELEKQNEANKNNYSTIWAQLMGQDYVSSTNYKHGTWFKKASTSNEYASLLGKTYEDIEKLYNSDQLTEKAKVLFEQLQKIKDEGVDINEMLTQQAEAMREAYTSTTADAITESIVSGFENGYKSAADFAADFESMMKKAVLQALKLQVLEEPIRAWYESFAASMTAGTIGQDMNKLNAEWNSIISKASDWMSAAEKATGLSFGTTAQTADSNGIKTINQETASKLEGHFVAVRVYSGKLVESASIICDRMARQVLHLAAIEKNTNELVRLENMETILKRLEADGIKLRA